MTTTQILSDIKSILLSTLTYLHRNAWTIIFILGGAYLCYDNFLHPLIHKYQTHQSYLQATNPNRIAVLSPDLKRVRANQQQLAQKRAMEAKEQERQRIKVEKERKRVKSPEEERWDALGGEGRRLGVADSDNGEDVGGADVGLRQRR